MKLLNLGCGSRFKKDWINIDFKSSDPAVKACNLLEGIPLPDSYVGFVYHSHVLEHFSKNRAQFFLSECLRVLKPGGSLRVVVPDLEGIVRSYLESLDDAKAGKDGADSRYEWMKIELLDQMVREKPGGEMRTYLSAETIPAKDFIINRLGVEAKRIIENAKVRNARTLRVNSRKLSLSSRISNFLDLIQSPGKWREYLLRCFLCDEYTVIQDGKFRRSGEIHRWMYDSYSLKKALNAAGFVDIIERSATESYMPDWQTYFLDNEPNGSIYKPDSLYMEGRKPNKNK